MPYNLQHYTQQGHDWNLSHELSEALNMWLEEKESKGFPITTYRAVEMILKRLNDCCTRDSQKVTLIENAIAGGFSSIRYQTPIENNGQQKHSTANEQLSKSAAAAKQRINDRAYSGERQTDPFAD